MPLRMKSREAYERLLHIAREEWKKVISKFAPLSFPEPEIHIVRRGLSFHVDSKNLTGKLFIGCDFCKYDDVSLRKIFKALWLKYLALFLVCPLNAGNVLELLVHAMLASKSEKLGIITTNLFIELETWYYLLRSYPEEALFFLRNVIIRKTKNPTILLIMRVLELITAIPIIPENARKSKGYAFVDKVATEIADILSLGGVLNRVYWEKKITLIAVTLKKYKAKAFTMPLPTFNLASPEVLKYISKASGFFGFIDSFSRLTKRFRWKASIAGPAVKIIKALPRRKDLIKLFYSLKAKEYVQPFISKLLVVKERRIQWRYRLYPKTWEAGDPIEDLDVYLSVNLSPILVPGETTKQWEKEVVWNEKKKEKEINILIVLDTSGSMTWKPHKEGYWTSFFSSRFKKWLLDDIIGTRYDLALTLTYALIEIAQQICGKIALVNFSGKPKVVEWGELYDKAKYVAIELQRDGTVFPVRTLKKLLSTVENAFMVIISDCDFWNLSDAREFLQEMTKKTKIIIARPKTGPMSFSFPEIEVVCLREEKDIKKLIEMITQRILQLLSE